MERLPLELLDAFLRKAATAFMFLVSTHGVTYGLIFDVGFIMLLCMGHQSRNFSW